MPYGDSSMLSRMDWKSALLGGAVVMVASYVGVVLPARAQVSSLERHVTRLAAAVDALNASRDDVADATSLLARLEGQAARLIAAETTVERMESLATRLIADADRLTTAQATLGRLDDLQRAVERSGQEGLLVSGVMPPNICGPGKIPLEGMGGRSLEVHQAHQRGEEVTLPYPGTNLIGPCDAEDVARGFFCAVKNRERAAGEIFNVGSAYALTAEQFMATCGQIYNTTIPVRYVSAETYITEISPDIGAHFHFLEHMCPDIYKISSRLGYHPRYTPEETMERAVRWMFDMGILKS